MTAPEQPTGKISYTRPVPGTPSGAVPPPPATFGQPAPGQPLPGQPAPGAPGTGPATPARRRGVSYSIYAITVVVALIAIAVIVFVLKNNQHVNIWLFGTTKRMSVASALTLSAVAGLVVGLLVGFIPQIGLRRRLRAYKQSARP
jgi:uncharacterized integral membrane protein